MREEREERAWLEKRYDEEKAKAGLCRTKRCLTNVGVCSLEGGRLGRLGGGREDSGCKGKHCKVIERADRLAIVALVVRCLSLLMNR